MSLENIIASIIAGLATSLILYVITILRTILLLRRTANIKPYDNSLGFVGEYIVIFILTSIQILIIVIILDFCISLTDKFENPRKFKWIMITGVCIITGLQPIIIKILAKFFSLVDLTSKQERGQKDSNNQISDSDKE